MIQNTGFSLNRPYTSLQTIVDVSDRWITDPDSQIIGKREKAMFESPQGAREPIVPCHPYIFKQAKESRASETLSEILASYIGGEVLKLDIQRTFVGKQSTAEGTIYGVLMESFLKAPYLGESPLSGLGKRSTSLTHGGDIIANIMPEYEPKRGDQHSIKLIRRATNSDNRYKISDASFISYWGKLLAFDALINNGDRHHENWALVPFNWARPETQPRNELGQFIPKNFFRFSPIYDNGGGFGSELDPKGLNKLLNKSETITHAVESYANKGKAQMGFEEARGDAVCRKTIKFSEIVKMFCYEYPTAKFCVSKVANVDMELIVSALGLVRPIAIDLGIENVDTRLEFIEKLIRFRKKELLGII